jgi:hypothetical protein
MSHHRINKIDTSECDLTLERYLVDVSSALQEGGLVVILPGGARRGSPSAACNQRFSGSWHVWTPNLECNRSTLKDLLVCRTCTHIANGGYRTVQTSAQSRQTVVGNASIPLRMRKDSYHASTVVAKGRNSQLSTGW